MRKRKIFVTSDTHFFHHNIIEYENRPFSDIDEMNQELVSRWNSVVERHDLVYHLGDVSANVDEERILEILNQLNGDIILVGGNHDKKNFEFFRKCGRFSVVTKPKQKLLVDIDGVDILFSHHPMDMTKLKGIINLYGHVHGNEAFETIGNERACVCVERWDYAPVEIRKVIAAVKASSKE